MIIKYSSLILNRLLLLLFVAPFFFVWSGYAQLDHTPISQEEMESTFQNIDREPTNHQSFMRRVQVLNEWCAVMARSGKAYEVARIAPPGWVSDITSLKESGKEKEAFWEIDRLYREIKEIGVPQKQPSNQYQQNNPALHIEKIDNLNGAYENIKQAKPISADIFVDFSITLGPFSPHLFGAISGPYFDQSAFELTKNAGFKLVGVFLDSTKPLPSNVDDPSQYDFSLMDKQVEAIIRIGAEPMMIFAPVCKPSDIKRYSTYVRNVAKHLTKGWGNGHQWNVKLFRFGNEPDNIEFWKDTQYNFFETYAEWAKALKDVDKTFILVAPGLMRVGTDLQSHSLHPWVSNFLDYCQTNLVPVDYFSSHAYSPIPYHFFYENTKLLASEMKKYAQLSPLYGIPRIANDEWQIKIGDLWSGTGSPQFDTAWAAAHNINVLINMIEQGLQLSMPMTGTFNGGEKGCHDFLLVDCHNQEKPSFYAFKGFNWLYGTDRLSSTGTDQMNFAVMAGKSRNGMIIVFSNYDVAGYFEKYEPKTGPSGWHEYHHYISERGIPNIYNRFTIKTVNLPWKPLETVLYEHYLVDDINKLTLLETKTVPGNQTLIFEGEIKSPSVHIIKAHLK